MKAKITIIEVTEGEKDPTAISGDASHEGDRAIEQLLEAEKVAKEDTTEWHDSNLPLTIECDLDEDAQQDAEEAAIEHLSDSVCQYDYLKPSAVEIEYSAIKED